MSLPGIYLPGTWVGDLAGKSGTAGNRSDGIDSVVRGEPGGTVRMSSRPKLSPGGYRVTDSLLIGVDVTTGETIAVNG